MITNPKGWLVPLLLLGTMIYALAEELTLTPITPEAFLSVPGSIE